MQFDNMPMGAEANTTDDGNKPKYNPVDYAPFGQHADLAFSQGWRPVVSNKGATVYKNNYAPAFNGVMIDNKPQGHLEIVGNKNGLFDVRIADNDGKIHKVIMQGQPYEQVDNYFRNDKSLIQQRVNNIQQATPPQQYNGGIVWNQ